MSVAATAGGSTAAVVDSTVPESTEGSALTLDWVFGFNKDIIGGVHSLVDATRDAMFYVSAHTGVVYDYTLRKQHLLQGHCNAITACTVSEDKRWIVTADAGPDSMIVVWDSHSFTPIKTIFNPHPNGVSALDMSSDAMYLVTLSAPAEDGDDDTPQEVAVWAWTSDRDAPIAQCAIPTPDQQTCVAFCPGTNTSVATNGRDRVVFWTWEEGKMKFFAPPVSQRDLRQPVGAFTMSQFLAMPGKAVTATTDGDVVLWEQSEKSTATGETRTEWTALKVVRLTREKAVIDFLGTTGSYLVAGSADGTVRLFDPTLRLVAWFEDMAAGPITSVAFALPENSVGLASARTGVENSLNVPDFLVGTRQSLIIGMQASMFEELTADQRHGSLLVQGMDDAVYGLCAHPFLPQLALTTASGAVHVWDYNEKQLLMVRLLDPATDRPHAIAFDPLGRFLLVGTTGGTVLVLDPQYLTDTQPPMQHSEGAITDIRFSSDGVFAATADSSRHVTLFRYMQTTVAASEANAAGDAPKKEWELEEGQEEVKTTVDQWVFLGRARSHSRPITGLEFGMSWDGKPLLASIGEDKRLVRYNVMESSIIAGLVIDGERTRVEQSAVPTACFWPGASIEGPGGKEQLIVTANDEYKFKVWNTSNRTCRRTLLSPTFGGPLSRLIRLPQPVGDSKEEEEDGASAGPAGAGVSECVAYSTADRVVGLVLLPLDGNPNKSMGLIAHPREVAAMTPSHDGRVLLTAGGSDSTVNIWTVNTAPLKAAAAASGTGVTPFLNLLDGGAEGAFYSELREFFTYSQIRSQGEDSTSPRRTGSVISLSALPNLLRAVGFYPTEHEIENLTNEVTYSTFPDTKDTVTLDDVVRLLVNHRPVLGVGKAALSDALRIVSSSLATPAATEGIVPWASLVEKLKAKGESMTTAELETCVRALTGDPFDPTALAGNATVSGSSVAHELLGFEDY